MISTAALEKTVAAWRIERPECEPPPTFTTVGVAVDDFDGLVRHMKQIGNHLRKAGLMALPVRLRADHGIDTAIRMHLDLRLLLRRTDRRLDVIGESAAQKFAAAFGFPPPRRKTFPVGDVHRPVHILFVTAAVVEHAD